MMTLLGLAINQYAKPEVAQSLPGLLCGLASRQREDEFASALSPVLSGLGCFLDLGQRMTVFRPQLD